MREDPGACGDFAGSFNRILLYLLFHEYVHRGIFISYDVPCTVFL